jgi:hypothetical protein
MITPLEGPGDHLDKTHTHKYVPCALEVYEENISKGIIIIMADQLHLGVCCHDYTTLLDNERGCGIFAR